MICNFEPKNDAERMARHQLGDELFDRLVEYTIVQDGARYPVYRFECQYREHPISQPWVSGYGNGAVLVALTKMYECFRDEQYIKAADEVFETFKQFRREDSKFWVTMIDDAGYLWIEEMPLPNDPQPRILNGHIRGITGLYFYYRIRPTEEAKNLLLGAITTVHRYANMFRQPGQVNSYELADPSNGDYKPSRTVQQQIDLYRMTGETYFKETADAFLTDMYWSD